MDTMNGLKRTHYCGDVSEDFINKQVVVCGFVQKIRDLGNLIFIDLRDRTGIVQLAFDNTTDAALFEKASSCRSEFVLMAKGTVRERESKNKDIKTGNIEILTDDLRILSKAKVPPFEITDKTNVKEELRLKHRYLDLRRPELTKNIIFRHTVAKATRDFFDSEGFIEIETPILIRSTPEGARDYVVPSRIHNGSFYALPQSPQLYKQLLMASGFDKYIQLARCFRDEDLRADRQPEFTQIDMEMSFVDQEDVMDVGERYIQYLFKRTMNIDVELPLKRMSYTEAMNRYGSDKPDTRFEMEICDLSDLVKNCGFSVFENAINDGGSVRAIVAKKASDKLTRKEIDKLQEYVKGIGAKGLAYIRSTQDGVNCSFGKFISQDLLSDIKTTLNFEDGDVAFIIADSNNNSVLSTLGSLRNTLADKLNLIPENQYNFLWITEFPFFEYDKETDSYVAMHHPFTSPLDECLQYLDTNPEKVFAKAYDLVLNGIELSSGSIRITNPELQQKMFDALGFTAEQAQEKFGYLLNAFAYGAPPHGGMGIGLDRLVMIMAGCDSIRDVIAFPKVQNASELMTNCPAEIDESQLNELGLILKKDK